MLLQALNEFYKRATRENLIEEAAFTEKYIRWNIPLKTDGSLEGIGLTENPSPKNDGRVFSVPKTNRPKNAGGVSEFLWDGIEAVFCLKPDPESVEPDDKKRQRQDDNRQAKFDDFWQQIEKAFAETESPFLQAVLQFRDNFQQKETPEFVRWGSLNEGDTACWLVKTASGKEEKFKADNFTFQVNGEFLFENEILREFWRKTFDEEKSSSEGESQNGICLVSGERDVAISASHLPKISGVPGTVATGASLISFDKDSFCSYGIGKSYNSPVSFAAVEGYTNALNYLVSNQKHRLRVGETTLCFWARKSDEPTDWIATLFDSPDEKTLDSFMKAPFRGEEFLPELKTDDFYSVTLGGNAGRVVVRNWMHISVAEAIENFDKWFEDLKIVPMRNHDNDKIPPFNLFLLARSTVRDAKDLRAEVPTQLYRAALENHTPSMILAKNIVDRIAVDLAKDGRKSLTNLSRFALLKLIVNRNEKEESKMIEEKLNSEIRDEAYNCGRLLAIFEELQAAAHDYKLEGASVVERYYGTASSTPNSAFGILWRLHQHHLKKVSRSNRGKAEAIKQKIAEICAKFTNNNPPQFPRSFNLQAQGRFALGFYQQIAFDKEARDAYFKNKDQAEKQQQNLFEGETEN
jgi:CRISPR-associated protein Csd1